MKLALVTDTHFGARNDSALFNTFFERFYREVFFPYLDVQGIKTVVHLGDIFDRRKYINFQILRSCKQYFFDLLAEREIDVVMIPGNHDTYFKNTNELNSIGLLLKEYQNVTVLEGPKTMTFDGRPFDLVPWICSDNITETLHFIKRKKSKETVCLGHFEIEGYDMFRGVKCEAGMDPITLKNYTTVLTGHFHHKNAKDNIYYLGSPYEFTWLDYNDPRGFHVFDTQTTELTFIENPNKIFHKIYWDDRVATVPPVAKTFTQACVKLIVTHKTDYAKFDAFVDALYEHGVAELDIQEDFSGFEADTITDDTGEVIEDTMTLLSNYVDSTNTAKDKERLKTLLKTLYIEAQALETP